MSDDRRIRHYEIPDMTIDLFDFWVNRDLQALTWGVTLLITPRDVTPPQQKQYIRSLAITWKPDAKSDLEYRTIIYWAQVSVSKIKIEVSEAGPLIENISKWLYGRFGISELTVATEASIDITPKTDLTKKEAIVAHLFAQNLDYEQIGVRLGNKSVHAARKHAQNLAKKWNVKQIPEVLASEAKKRGFGI